jgi:hypothetical protein
MQKTQLAVWKRIIILLIHAIGFWGIALIIFGLASMFNLKMARIFGVIADWGSSAITLIATACVALSVYLPAHSRVADKQSKLINAPVVVTMVMGAFLLMFIKKSPLDINITNGFAMLALSGALFRMLPFSEYEK